MTLHVGRKKHVGTIPKQGDSCVTQLCPSGRCSKLRLSDKFLMRHSTLVLVLVLQVCVSFFNLPTFEATQNAHKKHKS
jgi:hypothetical protein